MELGTRNVKVRVGRRAKEPTSEEMFVFLEPDGIFVYVMSDMFHYRRNFIKVTIFIEILNYSGFSLCINGIFLIF